MVAVSPRPRLTVLARGAAFTSRADYEDFPNGYTGANKGTKARLYQYRQRTLEVAAGYHSDSLDVTHPYFSFLGGVGSARVSRTYFSKHKTGGIFGLFPVRYNSDVRQYTHSYYSLFLQGQATYYLPRPDVYYGPVVRYTQFVRQQLDVTYITTPQNINQPEPTKPAVSYLEGAFFIRGGIGRHLTSNVKLGLGIPLWGDFGYDSASLTQASLLAEFGLSAWVGRSTGGAKKSSPD